MYRRLTELVIRRPWIVVCVTVLLTAGFATQLRHLETDTDVESFIPHGDDALDNLHMVEEVFGTPDLNMIAIMREDHPDGIYNPESLAIVAEITEWLRGRSEFETRTNADLRSLSTVNNIVGSADDMVVTPFMESPPATREQAMAIRAAVEENPIYLGSLVAYDGKGAAILARATAEGESKPGQNYYLLRDYLKHFKEAGRPEVFHLAGRPIVQSLFGIYIPEEGQRLTPYVLLMVALFLFLSFRTLRGVLIGINVIAFTELWMLGFLGLWGRPIYTVTSISPVLIIAISVADCIHLLAKYYDAQDEFPDADRATVIRETMAEMGRPVFMTSLTTVIGFLSMTTSAIQPIAEFGILMAAGISSAFVISIFYLPALLMLLPLAPSPARGRAGATDAAAGSRARYASGDLLTRALAGSDVAAGRRPWAVLAVFGLAMAAGLFGVALLHTDSSQIVQFRPDHHLRRADTIMNEHFAGGTILDVMIDGLEPDAMKSPEMLGRIDRFQTAMEQEDHVGDTLSIAELIKRMNEVMHGGDAAFLSVPESSDLVAQYLLLYSMSGDPGDFDDLIDYDYRYAHVIVFLRNPGTANARHAVAAARRILAGLFPPGDPPAADTKLAGAAYTIAHLERHIVQGQIYSLAICVPVLIALNWLTFSSFTMGLLSVIPVLMAIVSVYGGMGYLGVPADIATIMLGGMTLGIGVDFAIHYLHKYRHCRAEGLPHADATAETAVTAGRALFFNAIVLAGGFLVMLGARFYPQMKLGGLVAATMTVCYVSTMYLFPAVLFLRESRKAAAAERSESMR